MNKREEIQKVIEWNFEEKSKIYKNNPSAAHCNVSVGSESLWDKCCLS